MPYSFFQMVPIARSRDAVGRMALGMQKLGKQLGWQSLLFTERQQSLHLGKMFWGPLRKGLLNETPAWNGLTPSGPSIALYHHSIGTVVADRFLNWPAQKKILLYHNITPADLPYFSENERRDLRWGREQLPRLVNETDLQIGLSEFSCEELRALGGKNVVKLPYYLWGRSLPSGPELPRASLFLVVGRVAPHKRILECLRAFEKLHDDFPGASLWIVGNHRASPAYTKEIEAFISSRRLERNIRLTGKISDSALQNLYRRAGALLTLSDHEGFCVPVAEAVLAGLPVVAYASGAIPETLGKAGILLSDREPEHVAMALRKVIEDNAVEGEGLWRKEAVRFLPETFRNAFTEIIRPWAGELG